VVDDGVGFEPDLRGGGGYGLPGMRERAERLGGVLTIESAPGAGTRVRVEVPR
jgi:signal transduction histidine kinase